METKPNAKSVGPWAVMFLASVLKDVIKQVAYEEQGGSILFSRNKSHHVELVILTTFLLFSF